MKTPITTPLSAAFALALSSAATFAAEPHVHGAGTLQLVLEGGSLNIELRLPSINVVGFEHTPRTAKHKEAVKKAAALLQDSAKLLTPSSEAQCTAAPAKVESELLQEPQGDHSQPEKHDKHEQHEKHEKHGQADSEMHSDFEASYRFDCGRPEALKQIKALLFQQLPKLEHLDVEMVTPAGQRRQRLTPGQDIATLP